MKKPSASVVVFLSFSPFVFGQGLEPVKPATADSLGAPLVAWSEMQKPRPVPQPLPPPDQSDQQPQQPRQQQPGQPTTSQPEQAQQPESAAQTFTGTIVKDGEKYVLKVSDRATYDVDDQEKAKPYEGKQVKVLGVLDTKAGIIHVTSIDLLS